MTKTCLSLAALVVFVSAAPAVAWNALGHKAVAQIAWDQLPETRRNEIVRTLRRHPRFDEDFARRIGGDGPEEQLIFLHAGTWPDIARGIQGGQRGLLDQGPWHYMNMPHVIDGFRPPSLNLNAEPPTRGQHREWNGPEALHFAVATIRSDASPAAKALTYCWVFHLVADLHQPMHSTALFCERFPEGDRGGNSIPLRAGRNLHALWDNLLGRDDRLNDVRRELAELRGIASAWEVDPTYDVSKWLEESHRLAVDFAYSPEILAAVRQPGDLLPIALDRDYLSQAGRHAQERVIAAGVRLAAVLADEGPESRSPVRSDVAALSNVFERASQPSVVQAADSREPAGELTHWLNTRSGVRHNSTCEHFGKTTQGRKCTADEGRPCGMCGG